MSDNIVYGAGGVPMVKQPQEVKPVEKFLHSKKEKQPLQEIYGEMMVLMKNMEIKNEDVFRIRICQSI